jgi:hypothetical protein
MSRTFALRRLAPGYAVPALAIALWLVSPAMAAACPFCKEALGAGGGDLVNGFFYSILFMLSMPFLILGGFSGYMYVLVRRARAESQSSASAGDVGTTPERPERS